MRDFGRTNNIPVSNAELSEFLTRTTVFAQEGAGTGTDGSWQELVERYPTYFSAARDLIGDGGAQGLGVLSEVRTMLSRLFIGSFNTADGRFSALQAVRQGGKRVFMYHLAVELEKKYYRKTTAQELDVELEWLRNLVRMAANKDLCGAKFAPPLSMHQYETWARYNTEIGCLLGKYIASVKK